MVEDPVADMLARIENGLEAQNLSVQMPHSNLRENIAHVLAETGFVDAVSVQERDGHTTLEIALAYEADGTPQIRHARRISRPARRWYVGHDEIPNVRGDYGKVVLSTPEGVLTGEKARQQHVGGELLFEIW